MKKKQIHLILFRILVFQKNWNICIVCTWIACNEVNARERTEWEKEREEKAHVSAKTVTIRCICVCASAKMCGAFRFVCKFCLELYTLRSSRFLSVSLCSLHSLHAFMHVFITVLFTFELADGEGERETPFKQNQSMNRGVLWNNFISIDMRVCSFDLCVRENL